MLSCRNLVNKDALSLRLLRRLALATQHALVAPFMQLQRPLRRPLRRLQQPPPDQPSGKRAPLSLFPASAFCTLPVIPLTDLDVQVEDNLNPVFNWKAGPFTWNGFDPINVCRALV